MPKKWGGGIGKNSFGIRMGFVCGVEQLYAIYYPPRGSSEFIHRFILYVQA